MSNLIFKVPAVTSAVEEFTVVLAQSTKIWMRDITFIRDSKGLAQSRGIALQRGAHFYCNGVRNAGFASWSFE
jgi:hypothetical protein